MIDRLVGDSPIVGLYTIRNPPNRPAETGVFVAVSTVQDANRYPIIEGGEYFLPRALFEMLETYGSFVTYSGPSFSIFTRELTTINQYIDIDPLPPALLEELNFIGYRRVMPKSGSKWHADLP